MCDDWKEIESQKLKGFWNNIVMERQNMYNGRENIQTPDPQTFDSEGENMSFDQSGMNDISQS